MPLSPLPSQHPLDHLMKSYISAYIGTLKSRQYQPLNAHWKTHKQQLLAAIHETSDLAKLRDIVLLMLYYGTQIQAQELCVLSVADVVETEDEKIQLKISRPDHQRYVLIDEETREVFRSYLKEIDFSQTVLFCHTDGSPLTAQDIFVTSLQYPNETMVSSLSGFFPIYKQQDYWVQNLLFFE